MRESSSRREFSVVRPHRAAAVATTRDDATRRDERTHLHDDVGVPPDIVGVRDLRPRRLVVGVREVQRRPGAPLDQDPEPRLSQLRHGLFIAVRGERALRAGEVVETAAWSRDRCIVGGGIGARAHGAARRGGEVVASSVGGGGRAKGSSSSSRGKKKKTWGGGKRSARRPHRASGRRRKGGGWDARDAPLTSGVAATRFSRG